ncbi:hypothetical protein BLNAU_14086 [Blattamonas nauphoetae]|uniref:Uncharacterized protein n=1 Tax=Blattamonas nauphoetae TaxID=2049346 RepID=A0ABQ9XEW4_9EUKA|nr:hypothetical protein BLNAU_14086 [Blattamonas nauphoetae]
MVRDSIPFDAELASKGSTFISKMTIAQDTSSPTAVFVDSIAVLLSSSHPSIVRKTLVMVRSCLNFCTLSNRMALLSAKLIPGILSTQSLQDLSVIEDKDVMKEILKILSSVVEISATIFLQSLPTDINADPQSIRDVVFREVLIPLEPSLVQISRNPHLLSWNNEYQVTLILLSCTFDVSVFHQPALAFVVSSHIPMAFQSLLSKGEYEFAHQLMQLANTPHPYKSRM